MRMLVSWATKRMLPNEKITTVFVVQIWVRPKKRRQSGSCFLLGP